MKVMVIEIKTCQSKTIFKDDFIELNHYLKDIIIDLEKSEAWKIQLTIVINFISYKDDDEDRVMHSNDNVEIIAYNEANKIIEKLFESLLFSYQIGLETSMRDSDPIFDCVNLMHCKCYKRNFKRGGSYTAIADWIKKKNARINPKNDDGKCFQYAVTIALNHEEIKKTRKEQRNFTFYK